MTDKVSKIIKLLRRHLVDYAPPASQSIIKEYGRDPYLILVSCLLSLRAKDVASLPASRRLFEHAKTPDRMVALSDGLIEQEIYSIGFFRAKTKQIKRVSQVLIDRFNGVVPHTERELLSLPGVGRKTANLVLGMAFGVPAICVDIHVHRVSNRLGLVHTKTPEETEYALQKIVPKQYWIELNQLFVQLGQNICVPISPKCSKCPLRELCLRIGVTKSR